MTWSCDWTTTSPAPAAASAEEWAPGELPKRSITAPHQQGDVASFDIASDEELRADELRNAFDEGYALGLNEARGKETQRVDGALAALASLVHELEAAREPWQRHAETHLVALATAIARHVVERETRTDKNIVAELVRRALAEFQVNEPLRIRLHPEDLSALSFGEQRLAPGRQAQWVADPSIAAGGCVVEGPKHVIDGRIEHVLERIYRALTSG
jgi:flagellar assembly protein FliH